MSSRRFLVGATPLLLVLGSLLLCLLVLEVALRVSDDGANLRVTSSLDIFTPHPTRGYALTPEARRVIYWNGRRISIRIDGDGRRIPWEKPDLPTNPTPPVVFLGDSYTFGNEENAADTFVHLVGEALGAETVNLGVGGYSTHQAADVLRECLESGPAAEVVVLGFYLGNDFHDNERTLDEIGVDDSGRLQGDRVTAEWARELVYRSRALSFLVLRLRTLQLNLRYRAEGSESASIYQESYYRRERLASTRQALHEVRRLCDHHGLPLFLLAIPDKDQIYRSLGPGVSTLPTRQLQALAADLDLTLIDPLPVFQQAPDPPLYNLTPGGHLSRRGHRVTADMLIEALSAQRTSTR
jgi:hypothetical protein